MKLSLTSMHKKDLPEVLKIEQATAASWTKEQFEEEILQPNGYHFIGRLNNAKKIAAFACSRLVAGEAEILKIAVAPMYQKQGIGTLLLIHVLNHLKQKGMEKCYLEFRASNIAAQKLYEKIGFTRYGTRKGYYSYPDEDAVLMIKRL